MRRRSRPNLDPVTVRPPRRLTRPAAAMTQEDLTAALAHWSATLAPHQHPPVILARLRTLSVSGLVPLDWAEREQQDLQRRQAHLRGLKAREARHDELMASATAGTRRHTPKAVSWA